MIDVLDGKILFNKIDALRKMKGWTIYELARKAAVAPMTLYNWRDRGSSPTLALLDALCYALDISLVEFLSDENEIKPGNAEELIALWKELDPYRQKLVIELIKSMK